LRRLGWVRGRGFHGEILNRAPVPVCRSVVGRK